MRPVRALSLLLLCALSVVSSLARADAPAALSISRDDLAGLTEAQQALVDARALAAQLDEPAALARLLAAERTLLRLLHVPGVQGWLAEVWLQMGLVAAQRGEEGLADTLLGRALVLDPDRRVGAAEAAPPSVARSQTIARARDAAQRSHFRIEPTPASATSWLDGRAQGSGAIELEVAPGPHLLWLEAEGHRPYAALIDALVGTRSPLAIALVPLPQAAVAEASPIAPRPERVLISRANERSVHPSREPSESRWWRRWPVWASVGVAAVAGAVVVGLAVRDEGTVQRRTLRIDPGTTQD